MEEYFSIYLIFMDYILAYFHGDIQGIQYIAIFVFQPKPIKKLLRLYKDLQPYSYNCNNWRKNIFFVFKSLNLLNVIHSSIVSILEL